MSHSAWACSWESFTFRFFLFLRVSRIDRCLGHINARPSTPGPYNFNGVCPMEYPSTPYWLVLHYTFGKGFLTHLKQLKALQSRVGDKRICGENSSSEREAGWSWKCTFFLLRVQPIRVIENRRCVQLIGKRRKQPQWEAVSGKAEEEGENWPLFTSHKPMQLSISAAQVGGFGR